MREIKFRAWDKRINKMCVVVDITWGDVLEPTIIYDESDGERHHSNMKFIEVMQYTGLKDKNGKEVYEGDILYSHHQDDTLDYGRWSVVEWDRYQWVKIDRKEERNNKINLFGGTQYHSAFNLIPEIREEVIGNIYENEDLLKK